MTKGEQITEESLANWMHLKFNLFSSRIVDNKSLRINTNGNGTISVVWGDVAVYLGGNVAEAIKAHNEIVRNGVCK